MADDAAAFARLLKAAARHHGGRLSTCNHQDPNVCTTHLDWRVAELSPPPDRFVRQVKLQYRGRRVAIRSNNKFVAITLYADLAPGLVFSVNRADRVMLTEPSELATGQDLPVFVCSGDCSASVVSVLRDPAVQRPIEALELGPEESLHVYANAVVAYTRPHSTHRLEALLTELASLIDHLPSAAEKDLELEDLPNEFHPLLPLIRKWGHTDDEERQEYLERASTSELRDLVTILEPRFVAINRYLDRFDGASMPPSAIALGALAECAAEALILLRSASNDEGVSGGST
jgi:hypothetical protein